MGKSHTIAYTHCGMMLQSYHCAPIHPARVVYDVRSLEQGENPPMPSFAGKEAHGYLFRAESNAALGDASLHGTLGGNYPNKLLLEMVLAMSESVK